MYKKILKVMASLQELRERLSTSDKNKDLNEKKSKTKNTPIIPKTNLVNLEIEEARYLLALIAKSDFSGKDIQIVYDTALKLQEIIKKNLEDNG